MRCKSNNIQCIYDIILTVMSSPSASAKPTCCPKKFDKIWHEVLAVHRRLIALAWLLNLSINSWWFCSMSWRPFGECNSNLMLWSGILETTFQNSRISWQVEQKHVELVNQVAAKKFPMMRFTWSLKIKQFHLCEHGRRVRKRVLRSRFCIHVRWQHFWINPSLSEWSVPTSLQLGCV